ncbi:MAG: MoxR family ATPase [Ardenticatenaceae bacterium]|nr:MoxR family ATPase [Ardenticatenaceae bacterium]
MNNNNELSVAEFRETAANIEGEVAKVIVGQKDVVRHALIGILSSGHVLLEGVPGLGKTMLIRTLSDALQLEFSRIQFTPDLMPADITGTDIMEEADGRRAFRFQQGPVFANLILADEINRATPKTQSAMLEAMQEKQVTVANQTYDLPRPFFVMATQNPIEQEGTYPLPEAQLDRFLFKINVGFPTADELTEILARTTGKENAQAQTAASGQTLIAMQNLARQVPIPSHVSRYVSQLIVATHPGDTPAPMVNRYVRYGSSPRGAQALVLGAKITALLAGRYNVSFEDVTAVAPAALRHRLLLNFEGQAEGIKTDDVITDLVAHISKES